MLIMSITKTGNNRSDKISQPNVTFPLTLIFFSFVFFFFFAAWRNNRFYKQFLDYFKI